MGSGSIGIKLADNKFFPVIDDDTEGSKTLELTTVSENQGNAQIHLYRSKERLPGQAIDNTEYIGTLIIENIAEKPAGIPTIRLKITLNGEGDLSAEAIDVNSGTHQSLNVSLKDLSGEILESSSDFDITSIDANIDSESPNLSNLDDSGLKIENYTDVDSDAAPADETASLENVSFENNSSSSVIDLPNSAPVFDAPASAPEPEPEKTENLEPSAGNTSRDSHEKERAKEKKGGFASSRLCAIVVGIILIGAALFFAWKLFFDDGAAERTFTAAGTSAVSELASPMPQPQPAPAQEPPAVSVQEEPTPPPVWQENTDAVAAEPAPPAIPEPAPSSQNVYYLIKWGDTLWDLAETYYRNPWRYSYIARYNGIRDPNLIIAGTYLVIPAE